MLLLLGLASVAQTAQAACTSPAGNAGDVGYAGNYGTMVFCNGTQWVSMAGGVSVTVNTSGGGTATPAGSASDVQFNDGTNLAADTGNFTYTSGLLKAPSISATALNSQYLSATTVYNPGTLSGNTAAFNSVSSTALSASTISSTYIQLPSATTVLACGSNLAGTMRYTSGTMQVCDGSGWTNVGIGIPTGTIAAFAASSCPNGWSEYTAARGRFLRGIDNGAGVDADGTRVPGNQQAGQNKYEINLYNGSGSQSARRWLTNQALSGWWADMGSNLDPRPANVAVTFCEYDGYQSQLQTGVATLASLTDVSVAGVTTGQVLTYSGGTWIASTTTGGATASGAANDVQFKNAGGNLAADTGRFIYTSSTGVLAAPTVSATYLNSQYGSVTTLSNSGTFSGNTASLNSVSSTAVSASTVSATMIQLGNNGAACGSGISGAMRYTSGTMQVCDGSGWTNIGLGVPQGTIAAFALTSCPGGWAEYTAARGRFLRGIDNGAGNDPAGTRAPGNAQTDMVGPVSVTLGHTQIPNGTNSAWVVWNQGNVGGSWETATGGGTETRPKNVAVIFCQYQGYQSQLQTGVATLASLSDVSVAGATTGLVLTYSGSAWVASTTTASSPAGSTGDIQFNTSGAFDADTGNLYWDKTNHRLGINTNSSAYELEVSGTNGLRVSQFANGVRYSVNTNSNQIYSLNSPLYINYSSTSNTLISANGGFVGIGTTAPSSTLTVSGTTWTNGEIQSGYTGSGGQFRAIGGNYGMMIRNDGANTYFLLTNSGSQYGTWNSLRPLSFSDTTGDVTMGTNVTAAAYLYSSDRRLKSDITAMTGGLARLDRLNPVSFRFTADPSRTIHLGLIAQDVQKVYPEAVKTDDKGFLKLDYPSLIGPLVDMLKELKVLVLGDHESLAKLQAANDNMASAIKSLQATNAAFKAANDNLARRLDALEKKAAAR
ncbi:tail fiber domain-containing protein [Hyphomicrobium sp. DY-1]|uniref:phage tail fiber protein n=1 Tax=Hyphomicrobium sp. DY-1 TaxID=3075650 RepID=UPI0039C10B01